MDYTLYDDTLPLAALRSRAQVFRRGAGRSEQPGEGAGRSPYAPEGEAERSRTSPYAPEGGEVRAVNDPADIGLASPVVIVHGDQKRGENPDRRCSHRFLRFLPSRRGHMGPVGPIRKQLPDSQLPIIGDMRAVAVGGGTHGRYCRPITKLPRRANHKQG
jgi:hypothetical protein